jgi:endonuclease/exonuclease/phosphatase family metal-dependent hydrolase
VQIRVATYNVQSFRGSVDAVADIVAAEEPDLLFVQECGPKRRVRALARSLEMEVESSNRPFGRVRNAVLWRPPWRGFGVDVGTFTREGRTSPRGFVAVRLQRMGMPLTAVSAHLGLSPQERERHVKELSDWLAGVDGGVAVGLDLNEGPESPAAKWLGDRLFDAFAHAGRGPGDTFPARIPTARIDYLLVSGDIRPLRAWVSTASEVVTVSDHRPVFADLELEGTKVQA